MKAVAILLGILGAACAAYAIRLFVASYRFFISPDYQPGIGHSFSYGIGMLDLDGGGIFAPSLLLLAFGLFLGKFGVNLWRGERQLDRFARASRRNHQRAKRPPSDR